MSSLIVSQTQSQQTQSQTDPQPDLQISFWRFGEKSKLDLVYTKSVPNDGIHTSLSIVVDSTVSMNTEKTQIAKNRVLNSVYREHIEREDSTKRAREAFEKVMPRFNPEDGGTCIIDAIRRVARQHPNDTILLITDGCDNDESEEFQGKSTIERLDLLKDEFPDLKTIWLIFAEEDDINMKQLVKGLIDHECCRAMHVDDNISPEDALSIVKCVTAENFATKRRKTDEGLIFNVQFKKQHTRIPPVIITEEDLRSVGLPLNTGEYFDQISKDYKLKNMSATEFYETINKCICLQVKKKQWTQFGLNETDHEKVSDAVGQYLAKILLKSLDLGMFIPKNYFGKFGCFKKMDMMIGSCQSYSDNKRLFNGLFCTLWCKNAKNSLLPLLVKNPKQTQALNAPVYNVNEDFRGVLERAATGQTGSQSSGSADSSAAPSPSKKRKAPNDTENTSNKKQNTKKIVYGGSRFGQLINFSKKELIEIFGQQEKGYDKTDFEWKVYVEDLDFPFTIYNYKNGPNYCNELTEDDIKVWSMGADNFPRFDDMNEERAKLHMDFTDFMLIKTESYKGTFKYD